MSLYFPRSEEEMGHVAVSFIKDRKPPLLLAFFGNLGAGKTTFIKSLAEWCGIPRERVTSPTFQYLQIYTNKVPFFHFDLYRLQNEDQFIEMGFQDYLHTDGVVCIEWAERIEHILPKNTIKIVLSHVSEGRKVEIHT